MDPHAAPVVPHGPAGPGPADRRVAASPLQAEYGTPVDRDSAYERLLAKVAPAAAEQPAPAAPPGQGGGHGGEVAAGVGGALAGVLGSSIFRSFARSAASAAGRQISRELFGTAPRQTTRRRR